MLRRSSHKAARLLFLTFCCLLVCWSETHLSYGEGVVLHLRNGDRLSGNVLSENTNEVVLATSFAEKLVIPASLVERRESLPGAAPEVKPAPAPAKPPVVGKPKGTNAPAAAPATGILGDLVLTNKPSMAQTAGGATKSPSPAPEPPKPPWFKQFLSDWRGEAQLGANLGFGTKDREAFTGRIKLTHNETFSDKRSLRNILDYDVAYGKTENVISDNRMEGSWKTEFDLTDRFLLYNESRAGYDEIRRIDFQYDVGPGLGYKWLVHTNFVFKTELGGDYQEQFFAHAEQSHRYSLRLAEEFWWQITAKIRFDEKVEFFPEVEKFSNFRVRAESNLSYLLRQNLTLSLNVVDLYDTSVPEGTSKNDLQIRSLLGIRF